MGYQELSSRAIIGRIFLALEETQPPAWVSDIGMRVQSDQPSETYRWLAETSPMRELLGGRQAKRLDVREQIIRNKTYESSLEVTRLERSQDKTGQIDARIAELASRAQQHWAKLVTEHIEANATTYDGIAFFGANHDGEATNDNLLAPAMAGSTPTVAEFEAAMFDSIEAMYSFKDAGGEPMNQGTSQLTIVVPVGMYGVAQRAMNDAVIVDGSGTRTNSLVNLAGFNMRLAVNPRFTEANSFYMFRSDSAIKPYILQEEQAPIVEALAEGSDFAFNTGGSFQFGILKSCGIGNGVWQYGVKNAFA